MNDFGNYLYELRKQERLTQREVAERLHVTDKAVSKWETGEAFPSTAQLAPLSDLLGVTVDELLRGKEDSGQSEESLPEITKKPKPFDNGAAIAALCTAAVSLVFVFLIGCVTFSGRGVKLYDYLYSVYKDLYSAAYGSTAGFSTDSVPFAALFVNALIGTAVAAGAYVSVTALALITAVRAVKQLTGKRTKNPSSAIGCYLAYVLGALLFLSHHNLYSAQNNAVQRTAFDGATTAGLTFGALSLAVFIIFSVLQNRNQHSAEQIINRAFAALHIALTVAALCVIAAPIAGVTFPDGVCRYSVGSMIRLYANEFITADAETARYEGLIFAAICYINVLPIFCLFTARLTTHIRTLCDCSYRSSLSADIANCVLGAAFVAFMLLPVGLLADMLGGIPRLGYAIAVCVLCAVMFVCSLAQTVTAYIRQKRPFRALPERSRG